MYYAIIINDKISGKGQCPCSGDNIFSIQIPKEIYDELDKYIYQNGEIVLNPNYEQEQEEKRQEQIAMLYVTRLDFIKILEELGLTWTNMKAIMTQYPDVEKELTMCSNVYRGNVLINQMIPLINQTFSLSITSKQLDDKFIEKCNREDLLDDLE